MALYRKIEKYDAFPTHGEWRPGFKAGILTSSDMRAALAARFNRRSSTSFLIRLGFCQVHSAKSEESP
jgi:hypothetical protein